MEFDLADARPWGRNRAEYVSFFELSDQSPGTRILDCAGGPSSFTAEMAQRGEPVVAADPLYSLSRAEIESLIATTRQEMMAGLRAAAARFVWTVYRTPEALEATRLSAMKLFLEDYETGQATGRYLTAALPALPFEDGAFDLALCSHFLFLYGAQFDAAFHLAALRELCRVAGEARIFPLLDLKGAPSAHLPAVRAALSAEGFTCELRPVAYEFQKGGNEMLKITRPS